MKNQDDTNDIVGYRLSGVADRLTVDKVLNHAMPCYGDVLLSGKSKHIADMTAEEKNVYFTRGHIGGSLVARARELKILDIWFEPIYENDITNSKEAKKHTTVPPDERVRIVSEEVLPKLPESFRWSEYWDLAHTTRAYRINENVPGDFVQRCDANAMTADLRRLIDMGRLTVAGTRTKTRYVKVDQDI